MGVKRLACRGTVGTLTLTPQMRCRAKLKETIQVAEALPRKRCQGWTLPQNAERMGRSVPSVASILRRELEELRKRLKNEPP